MELELEPYNPYIPQTRHIISSFWCLSKGKLPVVAASIGFADPEAVLSYGIVDKVMILCMQIKGMRMHKV